MRISNTILLAIAMISLSVAMTAADRTAYEPISLHPDNPRYLLWLGKPTVLVTSAEHYGGGEMTKAFDPFGHEVLAHPELLRMQDAFVRRVVAELRDADNLDYSFTVEDPCGSKSWGQDCKMDKVRKQLRILKDFMEGFDFIHMKPDATHVSWAASADAVHVLSGKGDAYAMYIYGGTRARLMLDLPAGRYRAEWVNTLSGNVDKTEDITHDEGALTLVGPVYKDDIALRIKRITN